MLPPYVLHLGCAWIGWLNWLHVQYHDVYVKGRWVFPPIFDIVLFMETWSRYSTKQWFCMINVSTSLQSNIPISTKGPIHTFFMRGICPILIYILWCPKNTSTHHDPSFQIHLLDTFVILKFLLHHFLWLSYH